MIRFFLHEFMVVHALFERELREFKVFGMGPEKSGAIDPKIIPRITAVIGRLKRECERLELAKAIDKLYRLDNRLEHKECSYQIMSVELEELSNIISCELDETTLACIPSRKSKFFEAGSIFGADVESKFPSIKLEIVEAGNCLAADLNTAAIFHLMRIVEIGLRALAKRLKVVIKKTPLEYATWETVLNQMESQINKFKQMPKGKKKSEALEFYHGLMGEFNAFKDVWRNSTMHTRKSYNEHEAIGVYLHVRDFMQRLATKVSE